jgi:hypothetical protein
MWSGQKRGMLRRILRTDSVERYCPHARVTFGSRSGNSGWDLRIFRAAEPDRAKSATGIGLRRLIPTMRASGLFYAESASDSLVKEGIRCRLNAFQRVRTSALARAGAQAHR